MIPPFRYSKVIIKMSIYFIGPLYFVNEKLNNEKRTNERIVFYASLYGYLGSNLAVTEMFCLEIITTKRVILKIQWPFET